jgi:hypothetical protein
MIGVQEIIDLTAPLHGGNRLAARILRAAAHRPRTHTLRRASASYRAPSSTRRGEQGIATPIISDGRSHFTSNRRTDQAA